LIKPNQESRSLSKSIRRAKSSLTLPFSALKISSPMPGSFVHRAHMGLDEKGHILAEGEVNKEWPLLFNGAHEKKSSQNHLTPSFIGSKLKKYLRD